MTKLAKGLAGSRLTGLSSRLSSRRRNAANSSRAIDFSTPSLDNEDEKPKKNDGTADSAIDIPKDKDCQTDENSSNLSGTSSRDPTSVAEADCEGGIQEEGWEVAGPKQKYFNHDLQKVNTFAQLFPSGAPMIGSRAPNWRASMGASTGLPLNYHLPRLPSTRQGTATRGPNFQGDKVRFGIPLDDIRAGTIIWHRDVSQIYDDSIQIEPGDHLFTTPAGDKLIEKGRYWWVLAVFEQHWNEIAFYTYKDQGLKRKSDAFKKEHVGIRPMHVKPEDYKKQNMYDPITLVRMKDPSEKLSENPFLHFTKQRSSNFNTNLRIVGYTDGQSIAAVNALRRQFGC